MRDHVRVLRVARIVDHQREGRRRRVQRRDAAENVGRRDAAHRRREADVPEGRLAAAADERRPADDVEHVELAQRHRDNVAEFLGNDQRQVGRRPAERREGEGGVDRQDRAGPLHVRALPEILLEMGRDAEARPEPKLGAVYPKQHVRLAAECRAVLPLAARQPLAEAGHAAAEADPDRRQRLLQVDDRLRPVVSEGGRRESERDKTCGQSAHRRRLSERRISRGWRR